MYRKQRDEVDLTQTIIQIIKDKKPKNVQQLVHLAKDETAIPEQMIVDHVIQLERLGKITLNELPTRLPKKLSAYLKAKEAYWYWATLTLIIVTALTLFTIPEKVYPLVYIRYVLGAIFILWLPGYSLIRALFPKETPEPINPIMRVALSLGMSFVLVPMVGLLLNYTPWGIRPTPITISFLLLTAIFATAATIREYRNKLRKEM